jgi:hypothetical protein
MEKLSAELERLGIDRCSVTLELSSVYISAWINTGFGITSTMNLISLETVPSLLETWKIRSKFLINCWYLKLIVIFNYFFIDVYSACFLRMHYEYLFVGSCEGLAKLNNFIVKVLFTFSFSLSLSLSLI